MSTSFKVLSSETGEVAYRVSAGTRVCRYEPRRCPTPMAPHPSPYAPYGRWEFGYDHLFMVEERILQTLTSLRQAQNYFSADVVLRSAMLATLIATYGPQAVLLEDIKFNITVIGARHAGALILAVPRAR